MFSTASSPRRMPVPSSTSIITRSRSAANSTWPLSALSRRFFSATPTCTLHDGRIVYSKGNDHIIDEVRCAMLAREQPALNQVGEETASLVPLATDPVLI